MTIRIKNKVGFALCVAGILYTGLQMAKPTFAIERGSFKIGCMTLFLVCTLFLKEVVEEK